MSKLLLNTDTTEVESAYNAQVGEVTQAEAEAGTSADVKRWTPQRVKQAIDALASGGGGGGGSVALPLSAIVSATGIGASYSAYISSFIKKEDYVYCGSDNVFDELRRLKRLPDSVIEDSGSTTASYFYKETAAKFGGCSMSETDDYIYYTTLTANIIRRLDVSSKTILTMTLSGMPAIPGGTSRLTSDGSFIYVFLANSTSVYKCTVSGTTITYVSTITLGVKFWNEASNAVTNPAVIGGYFYFLGGEGSSSAYAAGLCKCSLSGTVVWETTNERINNANGAAYGYGNCFFEWNGFVMFAISKSDTEDLVGTELQVIERVA